MRKRTKILASLLAAAALLVLLAALLVPRLADLESVRARAAATASESLGGEVGIGGLRLVLLPIPHLAVEGVSVALPQTLDLHIDHASVYPRVLPLLHGDLRISRVHITGAALAVHIPAKPREPEAPPPADPLAAAFAGVRKVVESQSPGITVIVERARLQMSPPRRAGSLWIEHADDVALRARAEEGEDGALRIELDATAPSLALRRGDERLEVAGGRLKAILHRLGDRTTFEIERIQLAKPQAEVFGHLELDPAAKQADFVLEGEHLDVASILAAADLLSGGAAIVQTLSGILVAGTVSKLTWKAHGQTPADLLDLQAMTIGGQLENGTVRPGFADLDLRDVVAAVVIEGGQLAASDVEARLGRSQAHDGVVRLDLNGAAENLLVEAKVDADASDVAAILPHVLDADNPVLETLRAIGTPSGRATGSFTIIGTEEAPALSAAIARLDLALQPPDCPQPIQVTGGPTTVDAGEIAAEGLQVRWGASTVANLSARLALGDRPAVELRGSDAHLVLGDLHSWTVAAGWWPESKLTPRSTKGTARLSAFTLSGPLRSPASWDVNVTGAVDDWSIELPMLSKILGMRTGVTLSDGHLERSPGVLYASAKVVTRDGPQGDFDLRWDDKGIDARRIHIADASSDATAQLQLREGEIALAFNGRLAKSTVDALLADNSFLVGELSGDFRADLQRDDPLRSTIRGQLRVTDLSLPIPWNPHFTQLSVDAQDDRAVFEAHIEAAALQHAALKGTVTTGGKVLLADADLTAASVDLARLASLNETTTEREDSGTPPGWSNAVSGRLGLHFDELTYRKLTWKPFSADLHLQAAGPSLSIYDARLCGIATPGTIRLQRGKVRLDLAPDADSLALDTTLKCFLGEEKKATGTASVHGNLHSAGERSELMRAATGRLDFEASNGRVHRLPVIAKALEVVNGITGSFGSLRNLPEEGLPYDEFSAQSVLRDGRFRIEEVALQGPSVKMSGKGWIDPSAQTLDLTLFVAPLRNVDAVVGKIPVVGSLIGGSLISIPVRVYGNLSDPTVIPLDPSAIGASLKKDLENALRRPWHALHPQSPREKK